MSATYLLGNTGKRLGQRGGKGTKPTKNVVLSKQPPASGAPWVYSQIIKSETFMIGPVLYVLSG